MVVQKFCKTHDGYYREPRCWNGCELLTSWSEPERDLEAESRARMDQESGELCLEEVMRYRMPYGDPKFPHPEAAT